MNKKTDLERSIEYMKENLLNERIPLDNVIIVSPKTRDAFSFNEYSSNTQIDFVIKLRNDWWSGALIIFDYQRSKITHQKTVYREEDIYKTKNNDKFLTQITERIMVLFEQIKLLIKNEKNEEKN